MILTQRQLEQLLKTHGQVVVPYRARLTPAAQDWLRHSKVSIGYAESPRGAVGVDLTPKKADPKLPFLYWSDGPNGVAKAALMSAARETKIDAMPVGEGEKYLAGAIKRLNDQIGDKRAAGGILLTRNPALGTILANKASHVRAIVACNLTLVEEAIKQMAANVLILPHEAFSLVQMKNLIVRFCRAERPAADVFEKLLAELNG
ncbi:MAG: hypothetical protein QM754_21530 [Tepidisphaeraceae bacterium]